jgi:peptide chain release factor 2
MNAPDFWGNQEKAQGVIQQLKGLKALTAPVAELEAGGEEIATYLEMGDDDPSLLPELESLLAKHEAQLDDIELKALFDGPHDNAGAILNFNAKDGGTDANDWAEMLLRMYINWAQKHDYAVEIIDRIDDGVAGIQSASIAIRGPLAYGYLKGEAGMHRLVRISPFNSDGKRMTSFAAVDVSPEISNDKEIEIKPDDIREDTYTSSGPGGQHVNKTQSAVRLTHLPSGLVAACQSERSQHSNREKAYKMLRAKLARVEEEKREAEINAKYKLQAKSGFGTQIRNYFQHPDQRVKDTRTGFYVGHFQSVLDGDIQGFLDSYVRWKVSGKPAANEE